MDPLIPSKLQPILQRLPIIIWEMCAFDDFITAIVGMLVSFIQNMISTLRKHVILGDVIAWFKSSRCEIRKLILCPRYIKHRILSCFPVPHDDVIKWKHFPRYSPTSWPGNSRATGEFPSERPVTRSFDVFFDLRLNERLSKQSWGWWFQMPSAHYDITVMSYIYLSALNMS